MRNEDVYNVCIYVPYVYDVHSTYIDEMSALLLLLNVLLLSFIYLNWHWQWQMANGNWHGTGNVDDDETFLEK